MTFLKEICFTKNDFFFKKQKNLQKKFKSWKMEK